MRWVGILSRRFSKNTPGKVPGRPSRGRRTSASVRLRKLTQTLLPHSVRGGDGLGVPASQSAIRHALLLQPFARSRTHTLRADTSPHPVIDSDGRPSPSARSKLRKLPTSRLLILHADEVRLGDLIRAPANRRAGGGRHDARVHPPEEPGRALPPPYYPRSTEQASRRPDLRVARVAPRLQQRFDDVQRRRRRGRETARQSARRAVRQGIVAGLSSSLHDFREGLVCGELEGGEGNRHGEGGRVGDVEGAEAFVAEDGARAVGDGAVGGTVDLHALFDDVEGVHEGVGGDGGTGAARCWTVLLAESGCSCAARSRRTGCYGVVPRCVPAHGLLHDFVGRKVDCVCRSWMLVRLLFCRDRPGRCVPAPSTTLEIPLHKDMYPSTLDIVAIAFPMPVYTAAGVGLTTCIRVCIAN